MKKREQLRGARRRSEEEEERGSGIGRNDNKMIK